MIHERGREDPPGRGWLMISDAGSSSGIDRAPIVPRRFQLTVGKLMRVILVAGCLVGFFILCDRALQPPVPLRAICMNNLKQIGLALSNYQEAYNAFPPAYIADETGRPMHSWRVLILPYLDEQELYEQYDLSEPWDGPHNIKLLEKMPRQFSCPARDQDAIRRPSFTSYVVVSGPGTMFPDAQSIRLDQITDGSPNTAMVAESSTVQIPWTKPEDLDIRTMSLRINDKQSPSISSRHVKGANVLYADGGCRFLNESITTDRLRSLLTIAGGEPVSDD